MTLSVSRRSIAVVSPFVNLTILTVKSGEHCVPREFASKLPVTSGHNVPLPFIGAGAVAPILAAATAGRSAVGTGVGS